MEALSGYVSFIEQHLSELKFPSAPKNLYEPLGYFLSLGGKRMRPILTILSGELFGVAKEESVHAGLCIELFHNFSLIHDDIMDVAPVRRGKQTVHLKWSSNTAILSGDVMFVQAYKQLAYYTDERLPILVQRFNRRAIEVCEGQQSDLDFESRTDVSKEEYLEMIRLKTSVLLGCALEFGAIVGRQPQHVADLLYQFGEKLGLAFQIQDDILDLYGNPDTFGKQIGGDVLLNKQTLLFIEARTRSAGANQERFNELVNMPSTPEKVEFAHHFFQEIGALDATTEQMNHYYACADSALNELEKMGCNCAILRAIAQKLIVRNR